MKKMYLIHGVLFQNDKILGIGYGPSGSVVTMRQVMIYAVYNGIVGPSENGINGSMKDHCGDSEISDFSLDRNLKFTSVINRMAFPLFGVKIINASSDVSTKHGLV